MNENEHSDAVQSSQPHFQVRFEYKPQLYRHVYKKCVDVSYLHKHFLEKLKTTMGENPIAMKRAWWHMNEVLCKYPPAKNENKFIYGISCERLLIKCINMFEPCVCLDQKFKIGSSYKNDCFLINKNLPLSIKVTKGGGEIIIINKHNRTDHDITGLNMVIVHFKHRRIYMFSHTPEFERFVARTGACIKYRSALFTYLKKQPNYYYEFPEDFPTPNHYTEESIYDQIVSQIWDSYT